jgi:sugar O-acyltransferase (sialic acid O-acetyltransferase NeuD family)
MLKSKKLVIIGDSAFAEVAYQYFQFDSEYEVVAFSVEKEFLTRQTLFNLPVISFEKLEEFYNPLETYFYAALVYTKLNRLRTRLYLEAKKRGYAPASYISSRAFIWSNVEIGEHVFIFEDNTIQPYAKIGSNCVLWSGNHIGHHSFVMNNCFIASHAVVSGFCTIGENSFIGVNSTIANNVDVGRDNWIGLGVTIAKSTTNNVLYKGPRSEVASISALDFFKVEK